jgi:hypothetical protein
VRPGRLHGGGVCHFGFTSSPSAEVWHLLEVWWVMDGLGSGVLGGAAGLCEVVVGAGVTWASSRSLAVVWLVVAVVVSGSQAVGGWVHTVHR